MGVKKKKEKKKANVHDLVAPRGVSLSVRAWSFQQLGQINLETHKANNPSELC